MVIRLHIDQIESDIAEFAIPEMGLSSARSNMKRHEFKLQMNVDDLLHRLDVEYVQWVSESMDDDKQLGSSQDELAEAGYPELRDVLSDKNLLTLVVGNYLFAALMMNYRNPATKVAYWFDRVTSCDLDSNVVVIFGDCYSEKHVNPLADQ
jgi:uncharacterized alpha/beta hydrolase family protein